LIGGFIVLISVTLRSLIAIRRRDIPS
jgi:hypothetical protein